MSHYICVKTEFGQAYFAALISVFTFLLLIQIKIEI
jgi:hypothetical protein